MWDRHIRVHMIEFPGLELAGKRFRGREALQNIADGLINTYANNKRLSGIIFLHSITRTDVFSLLDSLQVLQDLCGYQCFQAVTLVTTSWEDIDEVTGSLREKALMSEDRFFRNMIAKGSCTARCLGTRRSAMAVVDSIVKRQKTFVLDVQRQMVDEGRTLEEIKNQRWDRY